MKRAFIDANIPMYLAGKESEFKQPCGIVMDAIAREKVEGFTSSEVLQEILYRFWYLKDMATGRRIFDQFKTAVSAVLPINEKDVCDARLLSESHNFSPRDLLHLAVMRNNEIDTIISTDKDFDLVDFVKRVDPMDFKDWLETVG